MPKKKLSTPPKKNPEILDNRYCEIVSLYRKV